MNRRVFGLCGVLIWLLTAIGSTAEPERVAGTDPWTLEGDPADAMVAGIDQFLLDQLTRSESERANRWMEFIKPPHAPADMELRYRQALKVCLGMRDQPAPEPHLETLERLDEQLSHLEEQNLRVDAVRWEVFEDVWTEGLLIRPMRLPFKALAIVMGDTHQVPEVMCGLSDDEYTDTPLALWLAQSGCAVLVPTLISRDASPVDRVAISNREFLYRSAFGLGRHPIGYEVQTALSGATALRRLAPKAELHLAGYGEGGRVAMYAAALDAQVTSTFLSGSFGERHELWQEPIDRNLFNGLELFSDAEVASLIAPRKLFIEQATIKPYEVQGKGAAPGRLAEISSASIQREYRSMIDCCTAWGREPQAKVSDDQADQPTAFRPVNLRRHFRTLSPFTENKPSLKLTQPENWLSSSERQKRIVRLWDRWTQRALEQSPQERTQYMKDLNTSNLQAYKASTVKYREEFSREVIGEFDIELLPPNVRSRKSIEHKHWTGYEVQIDVWRDVFAYGYLLIPNGMRAQEKRPVVVCQHGLEGRPLDTIQGNHPAYHDFAAKLCEAGYIVFAPQNPYLFGDRFRTLQRKANPLGKSLFSIIVPQHRQIVRWLGSLPQVDRERIGFYGLSYGGKSAMRIPALVTEYALSICSADFNDWVWKLAATQGNYTYVRTPEYEIWEYNLGNTFNYSDMAALIAPRPFMVERGHFDGVAPDDRVAAEYAKVRFLYAAKLGIGDKTEIEFFVGPHTINGQGTFRFLDKHLKRTP